MTYEQKVLTLQDVLKETWKILLSTWTDAFKILLFGLCIPGLAMSLYFDGKDSGVVEAVRDAAASASIKRNAIDFRVLLEPAWDYTASLGAAFMLVFIWITVIYLALVHMYVHVAQGGGRLYWLKAFQRGVQTALSKGIFLGIVLMILASLLVQVAELPVIIGIVLASVVPVILVVERKGIIRSLKYGFTLGFIKPGVFSRWNVFFTLTSVVAIMYTLLALVAIASQFLLTFDQTFEMTRDFWWWTFSGVSFGPIYLIILMLKTICFSLAVCLAPAMTVALYFKVAQKRTLAQI